MTVTAFVFQDFEAAYTTLRCHVLVVPEKLH